MNYNQYNRLQREIIAFFIKLSVVGNHTTDYNCCFLFYFLIYLFTYTLIHYPIPTATTYIHKYTSQYISPEPNMKQHRLMRRGPKTTPKTFSRWCTAGRHLRWPYSLATPSVTHILQKSMVICICLQPCSSFEIAILWQRFISKPRSHGAHNTPAYNT